MLWFKYTHDYFGLNIHKHKVKIDIYSAYASRRLCPSTQKKQFYRISGYDQRAESLVHCKIKKGQSLQICVFMEEQEEILFIWVPVYKYVFKTSLDSMHRPRKNIQNYSNDHNVIVYVS